jgi:hypothetical protein
MFWRQSNADYLITDSCDYIKSPQHSGYLTVSYNSEVSLLTCDEIKSPQHSGHLTVSYNSEVNLNSVGNFLLPITMAVRAFLSPSNTGVPGSNSALYLNAYQQMLCCPVWVEARDLIRCITESLLSEL